MKKTTCIVICLLVILISATNGFADRGAGENPEKIAFNLSWHHSTQFLGYYVAEAKGYYAGEGLEMFPDQQTDREFHIASFSSTIPLIRPPGVRVGSIDCEKYVSMVDRRVAPEGEICSSEFFESAWGEIE